MLVIDLLCEVDGQIFKPDRFDNEFKRTILAETKELLKSKLETVICKEHQQRLLVEIVGTVQVMLMLKSKVAVNG